MTWRNRVEISYSALRNNVQAIARAAGGRQVIAVAKADAYGLGLERCARIYCEAGAAAIAVAALVEADRVRRVVPSARVILLGSPLPEERPAVIASRYEVCCTTADEITEFAYLAHERNPHPVHIHVDTGMGRFGSLPNDAERIIRQVLATPSLRLAGIATHYPAADDAEFSSHQETLLRDLIGRLPPLPDTCWVHYANSEGVMLRPPGTTHAVRAGILLTGVVPKGCPDPGVHLAVRWVSSLSLIKRLPAGHNISYGRTRTISRDSVVGIVPVGYADGYPIALSGKSSVLIQGRRCAIFGRVTMDYIIVDLTDLPSVPSPGEPVVLIGNQGDNIISVNELAELAGTIPWDILCGLRGRCEVVGVP